jgi:hypothetical protein
MGDMGFDFEQDMPQEKLATVGATAKEKRIVCRFWLEGLCVKHERCNFLHAMDIDRMPECRWGAKCQKPGCMFKHTPDEQKEECINFRLGFCSHGPVCKFRHAVHPPAELPPVSELWTTSYLAEVKARKMLDDNSSTFRVVRCPTFEKEGWCSFFDQCTYAHGPHQIRRFTPAVGWKKSRDEVRYSDPRGGRPQGGQMGGGNRDFGGEAGGAPSFKRPRFDAPPPDPVSRLLTEYERDAGFMRLPDAVGGSRYFVLKSPTADNLVLSLKRGEWMAPARQMAAVDSALRDGLQVFFFFSVVHSQHFQGVARVRAAPFASEDASKVVIPIEWLRTCLVAFADTVGLNNPAAGLAPVAVSRDWQLVDERLGKCLMLLLYRSTEVLVDTSSMPMDANFDVLDEETPSGKELLDSEDFGDAFRGGPAFQQPAAMVQRPRISVDAVLQNAKNLPAILNLQHLGTPTPVDPAIESLLNGIGPADAAAPAHELVADVLVKGRPGYLFGCNAMTAALCQRYGVFSAPEDHEAKVRNVVAGTPCFLYNVHAKQVIGVFMARTPAIYDLTPRGTFPSLTVASDGAPRTIEFPWQTQVMRIADAPAMPSDFAQTLLQTRINPGPLPAEQTRTLAARMFSCLPEQLLYRLMGLLKHMEAVGPPADGLLGSPADSSAYTAPSVTQ